MAVDGDLPLRLAFKSAAHEYRSTSRRAQAGLAHVEGREVLRELGQGPCPIRSWPVDGLGAAGVPGTPPAGWDSVRGLEPNYASGDLAAGLQDLTMIATIFI